MGEGPQMHRRLQTGTWSCPVTAANADDYSSFVASFCCAVVFTTAVCVLWAMLCLTFHVPCIRVVQTYHLVTAGGGAVRNISLELHCLSLKHLGVNACTWWLPVLDAGMLLEAP